MNELLSKWQTRSRLEISIRILSNQYLDPIPNYSVKGFVDYIPDLAFKIQARTALKYVSLTEVLENIPASEQPEIYIHFSPEYLPIPEDILSFKGITVMAITDWNVCLRLLPDLCPLFDFCFTDIHGVNILRSWGIKNVYHQPLFGHFPQHSPLFKENNTPSENRDIDVSFCGSFNFGMHWQRNQFLYELIKIKKKCNLFIGPAFGEEYLKILTTSKLVFNCSIRNEANKRTFEAMACGAIPLIEAGNLEVPLLFKKNLHYFEYSKDNLEKCVLSALSSTIKMDFMRENTLAEIGKHTFANQITEMFDKAFELSKQPDGQKAITNRKEKSLPPKQNFSGLIKNNLLSGGYDSEGITKSLNARWQNNPSLENEILPGVLLHRLQEAIDSKSEYGQLKSTLDGILVKESINSLMKCYFLTNLFYRIEDWDKCIVSGKQFLIEFKSIDWLSDPKNIGSDIYKFLFPMCDLGSRMTTDINLSFLEDQSNGDSKLIGELLNDNIHFQMARSLFQMGDFSSAQNIAGQMSDRNFLSASPLEIFARIYPALGDKKQCFENGQSLFARDPLNHQNWTLILEGTFQVKDYNAWLKWLELFSNIASVAFRKNQDIQEFLSKSLAWFKTNIPANNL